MFRAAQEAIERPDGSPQMLCGVCGSRLRVDENGVIVCARAEPHVGKVKVPTYYQGLLLEKLRRDAPISIMEQKTFVGVYHLVLQRCYWGDHRCCQSAMMVLPDFRCRQAGRGAEDAPKVKLWR